MESKLLNLTTGLEIAIASTIAWWPYIGSMVRLVPSARTALWPSIMGLGIPVAIVSLIGLYAGLVLPESGGDPTVFLTQVGGLAFGIIALAFIVLANVGSIMIGIFAGTVALRQEPALARRISWSTTTAIVLVPVLVVVLVAADPFFTHFPSFLAICALLFGPVCAVQIVDYFLLRKQRLGIVAMYTSSPDNPYNFWGGFNPAGFVGIGAGVAAYLALLNPFTYESSGFYAYTTASIPSILVAGSVYWLASQVVLRRGRGGYQQDAEPASPSQGGVLR
jgi:NCS1 family nucleobase:cation symporter-1